jgi:apolipoprotein N-acyltransferase
MRFVWLWQLLLSVLGGVLIALGLPPWNVSWLIWVAFLPILVSLLALRGRAVLIVLQGVLFSGTFGLIAFHWLWKEHRYQELGTLLGGSSGASVSCRSWLSRTRRREKGS